MQDASCIRNFTVLISYFAGVVLMFFREFQFVLCCEIITRYLDQIILCIALYHTAVIVLNYLVILMGYMAWPESNNKFDVIFEYMYSKNNNYKLKLIQSLLTFITRRQLPPKMYW